MENQLAGRRRSARAGTGEHGSVEHTKLGIAILASAAMQRQFALRGCVGPQWPAHATDVVGEWRFRSAADAARHCHQPHFSVEEQIAVFQLIEETYLRATTKGSLTGCVGRISPL